MMGVTFPGEREVAFNCGDPGGQQGGRRVVNGHELEDEPGRVG